MKRAVDFKKPIYKICSENDWKSAQKNGLFKGAGIDLKDGFIHFSSSKQVKETAKLHFSGMRKLLLLKIDPSGLNIEWEPSRNNSLFPHLYDDLPLENVKSIFKLRLDKNNNHIFPPELND